MMAAFVCLREISSIIHTRWKQLTSRYRLKDKKSIGVGNDENNNGYFRNCIDIYWM